MTYQEKLIIYERRKRILREKKLEPDDYEFELKKIIDDLKI